MVRNSKRVIKEKQGKRLPFFLAVSLAFHTIAAVTAPAIIDFYSDKSRINQNLAYVDVVRETKPAETRRDKSRNIPAQHARANASAPEEASAPREISPPIAEPAPKEIPAHREISASAASSYKISAPADKPAPENAPGPDISAAVTHMAGPLKTSGNETLIASVEKNISAPGVPDGVAFPAPARPQRCCRPPEKKGQGRQEGLGRGGGGRQTSWGWEI